MQIFAPESLISHAPGATHLPVLEGDVPTNWAPRHLFSFAIAKALSTSASASFTLILKTAEADFLLDELRRAKFHGWSCERRENGEVSSLDFKVSFDSSTTISGVSIVIPAYNNPLKELERSIGSAARALEVAGIARASQIIVVDDASKVPLSTLHDELTCAAMETPLKIERLAINMGVARARNLGVKASGSRVVLFLDADDEIHPLHVRAALAQIEAGAEVVGFDMTIPGTNELICGRSAGVPEVFIRNSFGSGIAVNLDGRTVRRLLSFQPLYNPLFTACYEDWELNCVLWLARADISIVPMPTYIYHRRPSGRDARARRLHPYFKRALPLSAKFRAALVKLSLNYQD